MLVELDSTRGFLLVAESLLELGIALFLFWLVLRRKLVAELVFRPKALSGRRKLMAELAGASKLLLLVMGSELVVNSTCRGAYKLLEGRLGGRLGLDGSSISISGSIGKILVDGEESRIGVPGGSMPTVGVLGPSMSMRVYKQAD